MLLFRDCHEMTPEEQSILESEELRDLMLLFITNSSHILKCYEMMNVCKNNHCPCITKKLINRTVLNCMYMLLLDTHKQIINEDGEKSPEDKISFNKSKDSNALIFISELIHFKSNSIVNQLIAIFTILSITILSKYSLENPSEINKNALTEKALIKAKA
ncbi:hypothetical protein CWI41_021910 [Ordospora colligata]|nr:hypothetical protein CWI41_021910 [Ordospora colligata]